MCKNGKSRKLEGQTCENNVQNSEEHTILTRIMRSTIQSPKTSQSTAVFPKVCLFFNEARKRIKDKEQELSSAESKNFEQNTRKYFEWQDDQILSVRLSNVVFSEKGIKYHGTCRVKYQTAAEAKIIIIKKEASQVNYTESHAGYWNREIHERFKRKHTKLLAAT